MISNVHSHSRWCRHGRGTLEEYVKEGLRCGLEEMAVCEHVASERADGPADDLGRNAGISGGGR